STVILAIAGYGVWALVLGTMIGSFCHRTASIRFALKYANWKPRFKFRRWALKDCFSFGAWVYFSTFVSFGINKVDYFLIGKF
ncbi:MAG: oligosaccharide flippase family protein, partial [Calditrichaeota bacterium]|nr:oligosaccharide flippase family protein [Calditrichota bacterium]